MKKSIIANIISAIFILLFVYAATSKWLDAAAFKNQLGQSPLLTAFVPWVFWAIPFTELFIAILLLSRHHWLVGMFMAFGLMVMFTAYIIAIRYFNEYVPCSCGGVLQKLNWEQHLIFNVILIVLACTGILLYTPDRNSPHAI